MQPPIDYRPVDKSTPHQWTRWSYHSTLGPICLAFDKNTLAELTFSPSTYPPLPSEKAASIEAAIARDWAQSPPLAAHGTPFQHQVWAVLTQLKPHDTMTYGQVAKAIGKNKAFQAVGGAVKMNPLNWIIPCHRVILSDGRLGGFRWGTTIKSHLMKKDGCKQYE